MFRMVDARLADFLAGIDAMRTPQSAIDRYDGGGRGGRSVNVGKERRGALGYVRCGGVRNGVGRLRKQHGSRKHRDMGSSGVPERNSAPDRRMPTEAASGETSLREGQEMEEDEQQTVREMQERLARHAEAVSLYEADLRRHRFRIVLIAVPGLVSVLALMAVLFPFPVIPLWLELVYLSGALQIVTLLSFVLCGFGAVMMYLQTGFRAPRVPLLEPAPRAAGEAAEKFDRFMRDVTGRLESLEAEGRAAWPSGASDDELVEKVRERIDGKATEEYLDEIRSAVRAEDSRGRQAEASGRLEETIDRLRSELGALTRRGNFNLVAGSFVAVGGMVVLGYFVFAMMGEAQPNANGWDFVRRFLPQLSLVTIVEVFAYFFLRLYSRSLTEIKYFQNEISNFEAKLTSVGTALETGDGELLGDVVRELARTERNHILKKGETAVAADQWKTDEAGGLALVRALGSALKSDRPRAG